MTRRARTSKGSLAAASLVLAITVAAVLYFTDAPASAPAPPPGASAGAAVPAPPGPTLDSAAAAAAVAALPDAAYRDDGSYAGHRDDLFGDSWSFDFDGNGCDARNDILRRDLTAVSLQPARCVVETGTLADPYTGESISFVQGADTSDDVQIDHLLPLKAVYATGGAAWTFEKRRALANDPVNLLAVKGSENGSKSDSLPSEWLPGVYPDVSDRHDAGQRVVWDDLPSDTALQCWYVKKLVPVFVAYELGVTPEDRAAMSAVLRTC
ncbi:HNH endonuclease family protein [Cryobacterium tagatosivorans]|uniref:HNH endonuclease n=1 Tax=Cryobacterium tagatosivorans TaxID=1259199 RepID=A0A4R8UA55_9MICO|nr:HNH endonuclease family protein [Cryobacterium tagatosivorans]TFB46775.1 HNH endonuclease [Cryobacterium tagatosivorans]